MTIANNKGADHKSLSRRLVLKWTGSAAIAIAGIGGVPQKFLLTEAFAADLGEGDVGILNYAYALEQLEAAFYTKVLERPYGDMKTDETQILTDIRDHEKAHVNFLKTALGDKAIPDLEVDFSKVDFSSRDMVLTTAKTFEDLGVAAYNGAGKLLKDPEHLLAAGRIVSVEARHAATVRDLLNPNSVAFAGPDVVDKHGLDDAKAPGAVLKAAGPFISTEITTHSF